RGDLYAQTTLWLRAGYVARLLQDNPSEALQGIKGAMSRWSQRQLFLQHYWCMLTECEIALYRGDGAGAWSLIEERWAPVEASHMLRSHYMRLEAYHLRSRAALASGRLALAEADARRMRREGAAWGTAHATAIGGAIALQRGDKQAAIAQL